MDAFFTRLRLFSLQSGRGFLCAAKKNEMDDLLVLCNEPLRALLVSNCDSPWSTLYADGPLVHGFSVEDVAAALF